MRNLTILLIIILFVRVLCFKQKQNYWKKEKISNFQRIMHMGHKLLVFFGKRINNLEKILKQSVNMYIWLVCTYI